MEPTQGPYTVARNGANIYIRCEERPIAQVFDHIPQAEANAALLAASWEMWKALELALIYLEDGTPFNRC